MLQKSLTYKKCADKNVGKNNGGLVSQLIREKEMYLYIHLLFQ